MTYFHLLGNLCRHTGVVYNDRAYVFGGQKHATENSSELWFFDLLATRWNLIDNKKGSLAPPSVDSHTCSLLIEEDGSAALVVFGGFLGHVGEYTNKVLRFDLTLEKWSILFDNPDQILDAPFPRGGHGSAIQNQNLYIFGGTDGDLKYNDLWKFDISKKVWNEIKIENCPDVIFLL